MLDNHIPAGAKMYWFTTICEWERLPDWFQGVFFCMLTIILQQFKIFSTVRSAVLRVSFEWKATERHAEFDIDTRWKQRFFFSPHWWQGKILRAGKACETVVALRRYLDSRKALELEPRNSLSEQPVILREREVGFIVSAQLHKCLCGFCQKFVFVIGDVKISSELQLLNLYCDDQPLP